MVLDVDPAEKCGPRRLDDHYTDEEDVGHLKCMLYSEWNSQEGFANRSLAFFFSSCNPSAQLPRYIICSHMQPTCQYLRNE